MSSYSKIAIQIPVVVPYLCIIYCHFHQAQIPWCQQCTKCVVGMGCNHSRRFIYSDSIYSADSANESIGNIDNCDCLSTLSSHYHYSTSLSIKTGEWKRQSISEIVSVYERERAWECVS